MKKPKVIALNDTMVSKESVKNLTKLCPATQRKQIEAFVNNK